MRTLFEALIDAAGESSSYATVRENDIYSSALEGAVALSPLSMSWGMIQEFDPFSQDSALTQVRIAMMTISQEIVGIFLHGSDCDQAVKDANDGLCGELPSKKDVISIHETRGGEIFLGSVCDSGEYRYGSM